MIRELASGIYNFFSSAFGALFSFLGGLFSALFSGLKELLKFLFEPILALVGTIFYFLYKLGMVILKVIKLIYSLLIFFISTMQGLFVTLIGLSYNGVSAPVPARYQEVFNHVVPALQTAQLDKFAVLLLWAIWIFIGVAIVKIISARG